MDALLIVVILGAVGLAAAGAVGVFGLMVARRQQAHGRQDWQTTLGSGALPPSLHPKIDGDLCIGSGNCVLVCPEKEVLAVVDGQARLVNPTACIGHGECLRACPVNAISLVLGNERRGVDIPLVGANFETNVPGIFVVGELGGMGLIYNAMTQALQCLDDLKRSLPPQQDGIHQLVIVGAGPAGIAASLSALEGGLDFVTVDQEALGGTVLQYPRQKLVMTKPVDLPLYGKLQVTEVQKEDLLGVWQQIAAKSGLEVRERCKVESVTQRDDGVFVIKTPGDALLAQRVVLALGRRGTPRKLGVPGEDTAKVAYRLLDPDQYAGSRVLVVGGGDSAVEAACSLGDVGSTVHLSYRKPNFGRIKKKNQARLDAAVAEKRVQLLLESTVKGIHADRVELKAAEPTVLGNDYVLVLAGGVLPTKFLEEAGVEVKKFTGEAFAPANQ